MDHRGVHWGVVVGGREGVVAVVREGHVRGRARLAVGGDGNVGVDVVREAVRKATWSTHVLLSHALVLAQGPMGGDWAISG